MCKKLSLASAALFCMLLLLVSTALADEDSPVRRTAVESSKEEAATLLETGKATEAYELYMRLLREVPDDDEVNIGLARAAMQSGRFNQAVMAFERLVDKYPQTAPFYEGLANAYMALNARASAEQTLADMRAAGAYGESGISEVLDNLESSYSLLQVHGRVRAGILYDTNANLGPRSNSLQVGPWPVKLDDGKAVESVGGYLGAELELARRFYRDSSWWLVADVQASLRGNTNNDLSPTNSRTSQWYRTAIGLRHIGSETLFDMRFKGGVLDYEGVKHVSAFGPEGTFVWAVEPFLQLITRAEVSQRIYSDESAYNGAYASIGEYARLFFGEANHEFLFGVSYLGGWAKNKDYSYDGWEVLAKTVFKLPYDFELAPFIAYTQEYYRGPATTLEESKREDKRWRVGGALTYHINEAWSVELMYQHVDNESNSAVYDYDQDVISTGVAWSF